MWKMEYIAQLGNYFIQTTKVGKIFINAECLKEEGENLGSYGGN